MISFLYIFCVLLYISLMAAQRWADVVMYIQSVRWSVCSYKFLSWRLFSVSFFHPLWYHFDFNVPVCIQSWRGQEEKIKRNPSISSRFNGRMSKKKRDRGIHRPATLQWENPPRWIYPTIVFLYQQLERVYSMYNHRTLPTSSSFLSFSWQALFDNDFRAAALFYQHPAQQHIHLRLNFVKKQRVYYSFLFFFTTKSTLTFETCWERDSMSFIWLIVISNKRELYLK